MNTPIKTLGAATFALVAITMSSTKVYKSYSSGTPVLVPPMLSDGRLLTAQAANIPINEFTAQQAAQGIVLPKDSHNFFTCSTGGNVGTRANSLNNARTWVYEFTGNEPPFTGDFFISNGERVANPQYATLDTLLFFSEGKRYYQMGAVDLRFKCGEGLSPAQSCGDNSCQASESAESCPQDCNVCGDGVIYGTEKCDDGDTQDGNGCDASCNTEIGYSCDGEPSECTILIPELSGSSGGSTETEPTLGVVKLEDNGDLTITYSKNFDACVNIFDITGGGKKSASNVLCDKGVAITGTVSVNELGEQLSVGDVIRLCKADDDSFCGNAFQILGANGPSNDAERLNINVKGHSDINPSPSESDVDFGDIVFETDNKDVNIRYMFVAVQGTTSDNFDLGEVGIADVMKNVRLKNATTNAEISTTRLTSTSDFGVSNGPIRGTYQIYRFNDVQVRGDTTWQFLADLQGASTGSQFRIHVCGQPQYVQSGENLIYNSTGCNFGGLISPSSAYQMAVNRPSDNSRMGNVTPLGDIVGYYRIIGTDDTTQDAGSLYVTDNSTSLQARQLLGGTLGESMMGMTFKAEDEDIDVTNIRIQVSDVNADRVASIDRLELYREGENTKFGEATKGGCWDSGMNNLYCADMQSQQLVIPAGQTITVRVRPRMKTDEQGAVTNEHIKLQLASSNTINAVEARGVTSGKTAGVYTSPVAGPDGYIVLSKITSITNASPITDGTAVPAGVNPIGQFKIAAAAHNNSKNGDNDVAIDGMIFNVNAGNVALDANAFRFYNQADSATTISCEPHYLTGQLFTSANVSGEFIVVCKDIDLSSVDGEINEGTDATFVLQGNVTNPRMNTATVSDLQVSLKDYTDSTKTFNVQGSHILWLDVDQLDGSEQHWVEESEDPVYSTRFNIQ